MSTQKVGYQHLPLTSHFARSLSVNQDWSADIGQKSVKWGARCCRRLGRMLRHALNRSIRFHELQTIDSYRWLL